MAGRQLMPTHGSKATALLLAAFLVAPASAAPSFDNRCDDVADATLAVTVQEFKADIVSHDVEQPSGDDDQAEALKPAHYLAPETEANAREAFDDAAPPVAGATPASTDAAPVSEDPDGEERVMKTRVPGVTDSELARYRQQMYRIDI